MQPLDASGSTRAESSGATPAQALDNLLLVLQGRESEVSRAVLLARAQRREARIGEQLAVATAERIGLE